MEFNGFESRFSLDNDEVSANAMFADAGSCPEDVRLFWQRYAGASFNDGLYRVFGSRQLELSKEFVDLAFPSYRNRAICFSYDWLGRLFAVDFARSEGPRFGILMLEPGTGKALEIPADIESFHNVELISYTNEALASEFYHAWRTAGGRPPSREECIGYKRPLFLGGKDDIQNLEITNIEVYWSLSAQMIHQTRGMAPGTKIRNINIEV